MTSPARSNASSLTDFYEEKVRPFLTAEILFKDAAHRFQKSGSKWRGGCFRHRSKSGTSFHLDPASLLWYCPACNIGGGPIQYVHHRRKGAGPSPRGAEFVECLQELAGLVGLELPKQKLTDEEREQLQKQEIRRTILATVAGQCRAWLWSDAGSDARRYLIEGRGLDEEAIRGLEIGVYRSAHDLRQLLVKAGHSEDDLKASAVCNSKLQNFICVPWLDAAGRPQTLYYRYAAKEPPLKRDALGWRVARDRSRAEWEALPTPDQLTRPWVEPRLPKMLALPGEGTKASPLFLDRARRAGHRELVAVEGLFDALLLQARGDTRVISPVAAQFSHEQVRTLQRYRGRSVVLCMDPDAGGDSGTRSSIKSLGAAGIAVFVAPRLPDGLDPDEFLRQYGMEGWQEHIEDACHAYRYLARSIVQKYQEAAP